MYTRPGGPLSLFERDAPPDSGPPFPSGARGTRGTVSWLYKIRSVPLAEAYGPILALRAAEARLGGALSKKSLWPLKSIFINQLERL